jgi:transposase InsO family protein
MLEVAQRLMTIQMQFGQPKCIFTDNGTEFKNSLMEHITDIAKINNPHGTAYYPQGHGSIERKNRDITNMVRKVTEASMDNWPAHCDYIAFCINTRIRNCTQSTPFSLMFGRVPNGFDDFRDCPTSMDFDQSSWETHLERLNRLVHPTISKKVNIAQAIRNEQLDKRRNIGPRFAKTTEPNANIPNKLLLSYLFTNQLKF